MVPSSSSIPRRRIAEEAANLLYLGMEKEYRQAKLKAAKAYGTSRLPTNLEVAIELDRIASEKEGRDRKKRLILMRRDALELMKILESHDPVLLGSVWRGTIHHNSDIDITLYSEDTDDVLGILEMEGFRVTQTVVRQVTEEGQLKSSFHIHLQLPEGKNAEIVVRPIEESNSRVRCEIYGDKAVGLKADELEELLKEDPAKRFVPF